VVANRNERLAVVTFQRGLRFLGPLEKNMETGLDGLNLTVLPRQSLWKGWAKVNFLGKATVFKSQVRLQRRWKNGPPLPALWRGVSASPLSLRSGLAFRV